MTSDFEKHISKGQVQIDGNTYVIKPLGIDSLPLFFRLAKAASGLPKGQTEYQAVDIVNLDDKLVESMSEIISKSVKESYPEDNQAKDVLLRLSNYPLLLKVIMEINTPEAAVGD